MNDRARFDVLVCSRPCGWRNRGAAAGVRDASEELKCGTVSTPQRPLGHADDPMETIMLRLR